MATPSTFADNEPESVTDDEATAPQLYVALESERPWAGGLRVSLANAREVEIRRGNKRECVFEADARKLVVTLPDPRVSSSHAKLTRTSFGWVLADVGSTNGTFVDGAKIDSRTLTGDELIEIGGTVVFLRPAEPTPANTPFLRDSAAGPAVHPARATLIPRVAAELDSLARIAASPLSILLVGESGTGKELLAQSIHESSGRSGAFVAVNCGAIPESLLESHLFGHVRGAFSGATRDEIGLVRAADGGTLFLDEIGDLRPSSQAALLRVLQEREVLPVGSTRPVKVDVRVLSATHHRIDLASARASFRADLFARLAGYVHHLPPLRARRGDLGVLVAAVLARVDPDRATKLRISPKLMGDLFRHQWPLNIRELHNALASGALLAQDGVLRREHVLRFNEPSWTEDAAADAHGGSSSHAPRVDRPPTERRARPGEEELRGRLIQALEQHRGNVSEVARLLDTTRMQIHRWMKRFGVTAESYRA